MYSISEEDYLGTIYRYRDESGEIKANVIADKMDISNAAVTDMLKKLAKRKLVLYAPYKPIRFTKRGEEMAGKLIRRHRIWEIFLHRIVGMPWEKVHDEAERLEHNASDDLINRMEEMDPFPEYDPHGDPIPAKNGDMPLPRKLSKLSESKANDVVTVKRVIDFDEEFLRYITKIGIGIGTAIQIVEKREFDLSLGILVAGKEYSVSGKAAENIFVEKKKAK
ncbi:MAG: metal-dependent transcriptional regulator [Ignavibacteriales bacterium]|nr:metal-dependent transcriptional regulator [Ignavibacteriales bacterium]